MARVAAAAEGRTLAAWVRRLVERAVKVGGGKR